MSSPVGYALVGLVVLAACGGRGPSPDSSATGAPADEHRARVQVWRDRHEVDYRRDWVSIAGLHFLTPGAHTVGRDTAGAIVLSAGASQEMGRLTVAGGRVRYDPVPGLAVTQSGHAVTGPLVLKESGSPPAEEIQIGDVRLVVHSSGERLALRVRDPNGPLATGFLGFTWFPIDPAYRVVGRVIPDEASREMRVVNTFGDLDTYLTEGVVEFELRGQTLRLRPFTTRPNRFYFVFRDASSGAETYETARFLYADLRGDGTAELDFNEAYNPPCAFNPYTTCPIPMRENILPVEILAGERAYAGGTKHPE